MPVKDILTKKLRSVAYICLGLGFCLAQIITSLLIYLMKGNANYDAAKAILYIQIFNRLSILGAALIALYFYLSYSDKKASSVSPEQ